MENMIDNKNILLTGGSGSFGKKFSEIILRDYNPRSIRIYSRGELLQLQMQEKFDDDRLRFFIGDVRDQQRLHRAMCDVDIVIHAAALKQVPACEYNPIEAIKTNINGAVSVIEAAIDNGVQKVMAISTDKAVHPVNLYGATKMAMEKLFIQANSYKGTRDIRFSCVRYGNVIGSRGSVIPVFKNQLKNGNTITITDDRMTRFWITLEQGVKLVIDSLNLMKGGEIFIPKISSMKITDLAEALAPGAEYKVIGIRPGEKIHEILITEDEARHTSDYDDFYIIYPEKMYWPSDFKPEGKPCPEGFRYTSDNNTQWMSIEELQKIVTEL